MSDAERIDHMYAELEKTPELIEVLNEKFSGMDGVRSKDEFSRCLVFFLLGRIYEQEPAVNAATAQRDEEVSKLVEALREARKVLVVACGTDAPYVRVALSHIDAALAPFLPPAVHEKPKGNV